VNGAHRVTRCHHDRDKWVLRRIHGGSSPEGAATIALPVPRDATTFDLVVATVGRVDELSALLDSLERQTYSAFRVLVVDQNDDDRLVPVLAGRDGLEIEHLRSSLGLSHARNVALANAHADVVAFPDDDCTYVPDLLERVARLLEARPDLAGVTGILVGDDGSTSERWPAERRALDVHNVWHGGGCSGTLFLRRPLVDRIGGFDEQMGFGSGNPWELGEETDVLVRALLSGARIEQEPSLIVTHVERSYTGDDLLAYARRTGGGIGYVLGKNRLPLRVAVLMAVRPLGGMVVSMARRDAETRRYHRQVLRWRVAGYRAARRARSSANRSA
jgi:GT2 family glycosyltransferase